MRKGVRSWIRRICKLAAVVAVAFWIGRQFILDLQDPRMELLTVRPLWLGLSALLYLIGLGFSAIYWYRLLWVFSQRPQLSIALRAHYISQFGKYIPGKLWVPIMRSALVAGPQVCLAVAFIATFYEVLTTMAAGVLLAAVVLAVDAFDVFGEMPTLLLIGSGPLAIFALLLFPIVLNRVVRRIGRRYEPVASLHLPTLRLSTLLEGLAITSFVWVSFGLSLWAMIQSVLKEAPPLDISSWAHYSAVMAIATVAGFLVVAVPAGLGVREWVVDRLLGPDLASIGVTAPVPGTTLIVLLLRITWTAGEVVVGAAFYWFPGLGRRF